MRFITALIVVGGMACGVYADTTVSGVASQTGTIQPAGPRQGTNGSLFFNVEGAANGTFASYGVARWDLTALRAQLDTAYGAGQWHVTSLELELTQDNAAFSTSGPLNVFFSTDDATDCKSAAPTSPLTYPFFDASNAPDLTLGNGGTPVLSYGYILDASGIIDRYTQTGSLHGGVPNSATEVLSLAPDMVQHITAANALTLVFVEADPTVLVTATYHGQAAGSLGRVGPNLFITAAANAAGGCYANCDASTSAPILNVADFTCFLQKYAAGDAYANCDASTIAPTLNVADFTCFLQKYAAGCP